MKKLFLVISLPFFLACNPKSAPNDVKADAKVIYTDTLSDIIKPAETFDSIPIENVKKETQTSNVSTSVDCKKVYSRVKFPTILVIDELCGASTTYYLDEASSLIKKTRVMPDCPNDDKCKGIFIMKENEDLPDEIKIKIREEVKNVVANNKDRLEIIYFE